LDRRPQQNYRRRKTRASSVRFYPLGALGCFGWSRRAEQKGDEAGKDNHLRGARLDDMALLRQSLRPYLAEGSFSLGGVRLPTDLAPRHLGLIGTTGSGKSTVLKDLLNQVEKCGQSAIVLDTSGELVANYYNPARGDVILDPMDARGCFHDLLAEVVHPAHAETIANKLIPEASENDESVWTDSARSVVANVIRKLVSENKTTLADLCHVLQTTSSEDLAIMLKESSSSRLFSPNSERATASVLFS
jgi:Type IV secretion-system coupling protein DNA-binding domain